MLYAVTYNKLLRTTLLWISQPVGSVRIPSVSCLASFSYFSDSPALRVAVLVCFGGCFGLLITHAIMDYRTYTHIEHMISHDTMFTEHADISKK